MPTTARARVKSLNSIQISSVMLPSKHAAQHLLSINRNLDTEAEPGQAPSLCDMGLMRSEANACPLTSVSAPLYSVVKPYSARAP